MKIIENDAVSTIETQDGAKEQIEAYCSEINSLVEYHESLRPSIEDQFEFAEIIEQTIAADAIALLKDDQCSGVVKRIQELINDNELNEDDLFAIEQAGIADSLS